MGGSLEEKVQKVAVPLGGTQTGHPSEAGTATGSSEGAAPLGERRQEQSCWGLGVFFFC